MKSLTAQWEQASEPIAGDDLGHMYRLLYNRFYPSRTALARESFLAIVKALAPLFRTRCKPERINGLVKARSHREQLVLERRQKYCVYVEQLTGVEHISPVTLQNGAAPWRFNAVVEAGRRDAVFRTLLASGINASTWYPRMTEFLPEYAYRSTDLPVAQYFEQTLLNLWVDEATNAQDIARNCTRLKQNLLCLGS
jgi:hypothetical protein